MLSLCKSSYPNFTLERIKIPYEQQTVCVCFSDKPQFWVILCPHLHQAPPPPPPTHTHTHTRTHKYVFIPFFFSWSLLPSLFIIDPPISHCSFVSPPQPLHLPLPASQLLCHQLYITVKADSQQQQQTAEMHLCTNSLRRHRRHSSSVMARELWLPCDITLTLLGTKSIYVHERAEGVRKWHSALVGSG